MALDAIVLKNILEQVNRDMLELKKKGDIGEYTELYSDIELDFSRYGNNGGIGVSLGLKEPEQKLTYYLKAKQKYFEEIWSKFKEQVSQEDKNNVLTLIDYYIDALLGAREPERETNMDAVVAKFIKELSDEPVNVTIKLRIKGIYLPDDVPFVMSGEGREVTVRKPEEEDFVAHTRPYFEPFRPEKIPSAILEVRLKMTPSNLVAEAKVGFDGLFILMNKIILILKLFRQGDIIIIDRIISCDSILKLIFITNSAGFPNPTVSSFTKYSYGLYKKDFGILSHFWEEMEKKVSDYQDPKTKRRSISTSFAYDLYCDALDEHIQSGKRIAYVVMGLEGIYNSENETTEISYKLRLRVGKILSLVAKFEAGKIVNSIKIAYAIRSKFAHGTGVTVNEKEQRKIVDCGFQSIDNFAQNLMEYLRISIIFDIVRPHSKDDFFYRDTDYLLVKNDTEFEFSSKYLKEISSIKVW